MCTIRVRHPHLRRVLLHKLHRRQSRLRRRMLGRISLHPITITLATMDRGSTSLPQRSATGTGGTMADGTEDSMGEATGGGTGVGIDASSGSTASLVGRPV